MIIAKWLKLNLQGVPGPTWVLKLPVVQLSPGESRDVAVYRNGKRRTVRAIVFEQCAGHCLAYVAGQTSGAAVAALEGRAADRCEDELPPDELCRRLREMRRELDL